ncbi:hypothetical protein ACK25U_15550 [Ectopseudomonas mendocina]|jgi:hypothetical protein
MKENLGIVVAIVIGIMFVAAVIALVFLVKDKAVVRATMDIESGRAEVTVAIDPPSTPMQ